MTLGRASWARPGGPLRGRLFREGSSSRSCAKTSWWGSGWLCFLDTSLRRSFFSLVVASTAPRGDPRGGDRFDRGALRDRTRPLSSIVSREKDDRDGGYIAGTRHIPYRLAAQVANEAGAVMTGTLSRPDAALQARAPRRSEAPPRSHARSSAPTAARPPRRSAPQRSRACVTE